VQTHVNAIFDSESLYEESASKLRRFLDEFVGRIRALEALNQNPNAWGAVSICYEIIKIHFT